MRITHASTPFKCYLHPQDSDDEDEEMEDVEDEDDGQLPSLFSRSMLHRYIA